MSTIAFPTMFEASAGSVSLVSSDLSYKQCLRNALLTNVGELLGDPKYGCNIKDYLFQLRSDLVVTLIEDMIIKVARKYVPEVSIAHVDLYYEDDINGQCYLAVYYYTINRGENDIIELQINADGTITTR